MIILASGDPLVTKEHVRIVKTQVEKLSMRQLQRETKARANIHEIATKFRFYL